MTNYTPMIQQYLTIKAEYPDAFLFFRLGDFYELFFDDAILAARELEITLTKRAGGGEEKVPMCGVPYHSSSHYIRKLIEKGYKVAVCEQVENPKEAVGVVRREVVRMITPGTIMDENMLTDRENNYILFLSKVEQRYGLVACDLSTGEVLGTQTHDIHVLLDEAQQYQAPELIISDDLNTEEKDRIKSHCPQSLLGAREVVRIEAESWPPELCPVSLREQASEALLRTIELMLDYLQDTQKRSIEHLQQIQLYHSHAFLHLDSYSRRNLELTETIRDHAKKGSLLWLLDETATAMGGRLIKKWIQRPLMNKDLIEERLHIVEQFQEYPLEREELRGFLEDVYDLERLAARVSYGNVNPRDLVQLRRSLTVIPQIVTLLEQLPETALQRMMTNVDPCTELVDLLEQAILDEPALSIKEGGIFKMGYHAELDRLLEASRNGKRWIAELEAVEREKTGIKSLKVGYNKVFGYYIEVTKSNVHLLQDERYERKQTLANAERYITPELKEKEALILEANDRLMDLEYDLFLQIREKISGYLSRIQQLAEAIAQLDVLCSFARVSEKYQYVRPQFSTDQSLHIEAGRHPVVEKVLGESSFVSNDVIMDAQARQILLITGPNMAGKSTYMRQSALIVIMAQIGCFVPAKKATLPIFDRIFTRIGAADDLVGGQSTFMVEMIETKRAITQATPNSLILLDEIGRGTSTYDGMSLAQAVVEYIQQQVKAKTLFSTHYHELTQLDQSLSGVTNVHVACSEQQGKVIFLHKVKEGKADRSYGIHVAQLADMPDDVLTRAREILEQLEGASQETQKLSSQALMPNMPLKQEQQEGLRSHQQSFKQQTVKQEKRVKQEEQIQFHFEDTEEQQIVQQVKELNLVTMTPLQALNTLYELQERLKKKV